MQHLGIIPACAGNIVGHIFALDGQGDHPRVCGEHGHVLSVADRYSGSSPRVRGTPLVQHRVAPAGGIIPACAGNTAVDALLVLPLEDHPRVCGEHPSSGTRHSFKSGSSPRVRGTLWRVRRQAERPGIIPACAGNTRYRRGYTAKCGDHPRVCGEHFRVERDKLCVEGSSPRVRGTHGNPWRFNQGGGIIPACAGNTANIA